MAVIDDEHGIRVVDPKTRLPYNEGDVLEGGTRRDPWALESSDASQDIDWLSLIGWASWVTTLAALIALVAAAKPAATDAEISAAGLGVIACWLGITYIWQTLSHGD